MKVTRTEFSTSSGVKIIRLPVQAFPNFWAYVYLIAYNDRCILIDTGSGTEPSHEDLLNGLNHTGLEPHDLTHIILTHAHIDHYGGLSRLKPLTDAKIGCHNLDWQTVARHEARLAIINRRLASYLADTGLAKEQADSLLGIYRFTKALYQSVAVDFAYDKIHNHLPELEFIHLPGHCPGHVAFRLDDIVFCGDMVVAGVTPHLTPESIMPYSGLDHYLESLEKLRVWAKDARLILNGHDEAISDLSAQIDATHHNILRRMSKAIDSLSAPLTIAELCNLVYEDPGGYNLLLTIEKTGAYIEYLYEYGMIEITNPREVDQGLPAKYQRTRAIANEDILTIKNPLVVG
jgi:glyoxylase-like metal-dependent hydrolase (beta-lactamase superfamily II)